MLNAIPLIGVVFTDPNLAIRELNKLDQGVVDGLSFDDWIVNVAKILGGQIEANSGSIKILIDG
ncbi:hypothetical protein AB6C66_20945 [Vibrio splendidus]|uniref:hypothetical protein n=1 Tax=Vibrio splendidus TaxID=29497 RepID=UPI0002FA4A27|nr:hypothetical protein [Vibrio splendidus]OEF71605.1 hypothetical protein A148_21660 [Vibrio splendidus 1F-157]PMI53883.1 hypothetical protein BCU42_19895 [Vibrio splendidus]